MQVKFTFSCVIILYLLQLHATYADDEHAELCRLFKNNTKLLMPGSCTDFITCAGTTGEVYSCSTPKLFDPTKQSCVENVAAKEYCNNPCAGITGTWVADPTNCHGFFYCHNSEPFQGFCPDNFHFDEQAKMCIFSTNSDCINVANICALVPDKTKFRDETNCANYYECSKGVHKLTACKKNTYFNVETGTCVDKSMVQCTAHPKPTCKDGSKPSPGFKPDDGSCRGYFHCRDMGIVEDRDPIWYQCPSGKFFSAETKTCMDPVDVICDYNRCDGRGTMLVTSGSNDCHNYIICENGMEVGEVECPTDMFFDEKYQACVRTVIDYKCCDGRK